MNRMRNVLILLGVIVCMGVTLYQHTAAKQQESSLLELEGTWKGTIAPAFSLHNIDGDEAFHVGGEREKALIINFWASWCEPCQLEAPDLVYIYDKYKEQLDIYAVNITVYDSVRDAEQFVQQYGIDFPVLMDAKGDVLQKYNVTGYPTSFFVDKQGVIQEVVLGVLSKKQLERNVEKLIRSSN